MTVALDASTPGFVSGTANPTTTASFTNPAGSLLFAICIADESNTFVISNPTGSALTWTSVGASVAGAGFTNIQVYWAYDAAGGTRTVRSTKTGSFTGHALKVLVFTGTETTFTGAAASAKLDTVNVVTTANNSWVWAGHGDENAALDTAATNCTFNDGPIVFGTGGIAGGIIKRNATTPTSGTSVTIGTSAGTLPALVAFEVKEGTGGASGNALAGRWPNAMAPGFTRRNVQTNFNTPFQLLGSQDVAAAPIDYVKSTSDPVGITDTRALARTTSRTDPVGITDSVTVSRTTAVTDPIGVTDTRAYTDGENQNDPVGITDSATRVVTAVRSPADPVGITDTRTVARGKSQTDAVGITDSVTGVISLTKTVTDAIGITDSQTKSRAESSGEAVGLTDSVSVTKTVVRTVSDAVGVTDTRAYNDGENYTDPVGLTDARSIARGTSRSDPVGITDTRSVGVGRIRSDNLGITDARSVARIKLVGDTVGVTDGVIAARSIHVIITDPVGLSDFIPTGIVRDICVSLTGGPRVRSRALTGPRLAPHDLIGPRVDRAVTGPGAVSVKIESLKAQGRTMTGPRVRSHAVSGPRLRPLITSAGIQRRTVTGPTNC